MLVSTTVTGGTRGGAALCKQPLMAKPLSGLCVGFCVVFFFLSLLFTMLLYQVLTCLFFLMPRVCIKPSFPFKAVFVPVHFFLCEIYSSCTVFPASVPLRSFSPPTPPSPSSNPPPAVLSFLSSLFHALSYSSPSLLCRLASTLPPSHRRLIG